MDDATLSYTAGVNDNVYSLLYVNSLVLNTNVGLYRVGGFAIYWFVIKKRTWADFFETI